MPEKLTKEQQNAVNKQVKNQLKQVEKKLEKVVEKKVEARLHKKLLAKSKALTTTAAKRGIRTTVFVGHKFRDHASTAMIAALSFLIALAWKDFIVKLVKDNTKISLLEKYPYIAELYTAIIITIIAIIGIIFVSKWAKKEEK